MNDGLMKLCSVHDSKADAWMNPMCFQALGQAVRSFQDAVNDKSSDIGRHPEDYALYHICDFSPLSGEVSVNGGPVVVALGINFKESVE